jgi:hypothetical protein
MAYLAASNVTVTLNPEDIDRSPDGRIGIRTFPTVAYGNGVLQYPTGGIPMPALGKFGFNFALKRVYIEQAADGFVRAFVRATHKLRIFLGAAQAALTVANHVGVAPTGNVAAPANHTGLAIAAPANHSHDLIIASNANYGAPVDMVGVNVANQALVSNTANVGTIVGGNATKGGVQDGAVPAPANMANLTHVAPAFTGDVMANLVHTVTGGGAVAEAALAEMDDGVAPAATTLYLEMVGR